jgi:ABC-type branched-subunit amino acid transport system substrate-binding protein
MVSRRTRLRRLGAAARAIAPAWAEASAGARVGARLGVCAGVLAGAVLLAACSGGGSLGGGPGGGPQPSVKVALLTPLSSQGHPGVIARSLKQAAELALFERDTRSVELMVKDDKGTPEGAKAAAEDAVQRGASLILGPLYAKSVAAVAPVARKAQVPVMAFSSDRQVAGSGVYLLSFQPGPDVERIVAYAAKQGKTRYAALIPQDAFGKVVEPVFRDAVARSRGTIVALQAYPTNANAMLEPLRAVSAAIAAAGAQGAPVDALFLPGGQEHLELLARLIPQARIDTGRIKVLGTGGMDYPNAGRDAALVGAWYPGPDPRGWSEFAQKYARTYQAAPPRISGLAYDAVNLAIQLAGDSSGAGFGAEALTRANGFNGIDGVYRLRPDGSSDRALAILEVQKFGSAVIEPAPGSPGPAATASGGGLNLFKALQ